MNDYATCTEFVHGRGIVAPGPMRAQFVDGDGRHCEDQERAFWQAWRVRVGLEELKR